MLPVIMAIVILALIFLFLAMTSDFSVAIMMTGGSAIIIGAVFLVQLWWVILIGLFLLFLMFGIVFIADHPGDG